MLNQLRRALYWSARVLGDVNAVRRGPVAVVKRIERKFIWRTTFRLLGKVLR